MGDRRSFPCTLHDHGKCDSCGEIVLRLSRHSHNFHPQQRRHSIVCGECHDLIYSASLPVLRALESLDLAMCPRDLRDALQAGEIQVFAQGGLPLN
jgi:hypothetical protein